MAQARASLDRPLLTVGDPQSPVLRARGGHGRRGRSWLRRGSDGHKLNRRVRPVHDDHLPRWQEPQARGNPWLRAAEGTTDMAISLYSSDNVCRRGHMASASVPEWLAGIGTGVAALGTVGTLIAALWQINVERRARQHLEQQAELRERRAQAEGISAWPASRGPTASERSIEVNENRTWIALLNRSEEPVYRAVASLVLIQGAGPRTGKETRPEYRATLGVILPGQYYIDVAGGWAGMSARPGVEIAFTDRAGVHWVRFADGAVTEIEKAPVDYYELGLPQGWSIPIPED
jgi:hypothetical protein